MLPPRRAHTSTCGDVVVRFLVPLDSVPDPPHVWSTTSAVRAALGRSGETRIWLARCPPLLPRRLTVVLPGRPFAVISKSLPNTLPYLHSSQGAGVGLPWLQPHASHHCPVTRGSRSGCGCGEPHGELMWLTTTTTPARQRGPRRLAGWLAGIDTRSLSSHSTRFCCQATQHTLLVSLGAPTLPSCLWPRLCRQQHHRLRFHQRSLRRCSPASQDPPRMHAGHVSVGLI
ncbi:hypothetical protein B0T18DRAFT_155555 [Schizothecium vesticola]|uniref:Uncharacterized protein n=1 Tax=Schizothecium vesticola TaxID=314040 RepID=A0AA40K5E6_9PEZI|nr:hypothetical protein B0T18DRAFT_155555 [Schizothecium vesticola]